MNTLPPSSMSSRSQAASVCLVLCRCLFTCLGNKLGCLGGLACSQRFQSILQHEESQANAKTSSYLVQNAPAPPADGKWREREGASKPFRKSKKLKTMADLSSPKWVGGFQHLRHDLATSKHARSASECDKLCHSGLETGTPKLRLSFFLGVCRAKENHTTGGRSPAHNQPFGWVFSY
ncbi:hypothetical protein B0T26DRAFT_532289 [Lasiosphaeria miniovina]|uniref:Secreted protein n=1 Tax=Lasiosphaeria miniovina TaxID=1954250 RepID=A0AA39ZQG8_9PEZI|nr:uncharacterized protein B0T26DRAFT_532289 [Lasiosphaeria miniovina]KAK0701815.1 hypothetical protein B0T26DRAFT_532289 [Lasiosphaeria miniovina]